MTAEIVWSVDLPGFADHAGNVDMLSDGNILVTFSTEETRLYSAFIEFDESEQVIWQTDLYYPSSVATNILLGNLRISSLYDLYKE